MKKLLFSALIFLIVTGHPTVAQQATPSLSVSENGRYLVTADGKPFFYLGDTAWELFHRLNRKEANRYLQDRAEKDFTVIQAVALAELDGLNTGNAYGDKPLLKNDPAQPNEAYFEHVDYIVNKANQLGMFVGLLPTWGDKVTDEHGGAGPVVFTQENARIFGRFLGKRYKNKDIIWILGGDRLVTNDTVYQIWEQMALGIQEGDKGRHLITFHPRGSAHSYYWFHHASWLDFNMYQSGHARKFNPVHQFATANYLLQPVKPFVDGEPAYEDIPVAFWEYMDWSSEHRMPETVLTDQHLVRQADYFQKGWFDAYQVRVHAYWNVLSGACGTAYGNNAVWQMFEKGDAVVIPCRNTWQEALNRPGATNMKHLRHLFEIRSFAKLMPNQSLIYGRNQTYHDSLHIRAAIANDKSFLIAYTPTAQPLRIYTDVLGGKRISAWWYNPRNGQKTPVKGKQKPRIRTFHPPQGQSKKDWVLVVDATTPSGGMR